MILTPEHVEASLVSQSHDKRSLAETVKILAERRALSVSCYKCEGSGELWSSTGAGIYKTRPCPDCKGTGRAYASWQAALRSLGDPQ